VATLRYLSSWDDPVANPDRLCGHFLGGTIRAAAMLPPVRRTACRLVRRRFPGGIEYQAARTKHIDRVLGEALDRGLSQLVILGVGYDTRPYRFRRELEGTRVFEVDQAGTLARRTRLAERRLPPVGSTRVAVDFDREDPGSRLHESGFRSGLATLIIWEGVTMFITVEAVDRTLGCISAAGAEVVFDYVARSALERPAAHYGGEEAARHFERTGEPWRFGVEPEQVAALLERHRLELRSHLGPAELQAAYLADVGGASDGRVPSFHGIIHAAAGVGSSVS
jgi:methyltransferase (TIGR00027 family)